MGVAMALSQQACQQLWGTHIASRLCDGAIAGLIAWPSDACGAMSICTNEAPLSEAQRATLARAAIERRCAAF